MADLSFEKAPSAKGTEAKAEEQMMNTVHKLRELHQQDEAKIASLKSQQGPIGRILDNVINLGEKTFASKEKLGKPKEHYLTFGTAAVDRALSRQHDALDKLEVAALSNDKKLFDEELTKFSHKTVVERAKTKPRSEYQLESSDAITRYKQNHFFFHDLATSYSSVYAGMFARQFASTVSKGFALPFIAAIAAGAISKPTLTGLDGEFFHPARDAAVGAVWGGLYPVYEWAGARVSEQLVRNAGMNHFMSKGAGAVIENPGLFTSAIKPVESAFLRSTLVADAASVVPGWVAYDSIGYPAQLLADRQTFHKELPTIGETGMSHARGIATGLVLGPVVGIPIAQSTRLLLRQFVKGAS